MSVLIEGMEMPTSCDKCPFFDYEEGFCFASGVKHESGWYELALCPGSIKDGRHEDCPIIPVPRHGRLIDADAFLSTIRPICDEDANAACTFETVKRLMIEHISDAPTIIPADEVV